MAFIISNVSGQIQSALGSDLTITAITKANPAVVTVTNSLSDGDIVVLSGIQGMVQLNDMPARVTSSSGTAISLEGIDSTDFDAYVSGGVVNEVTTLLTYDNISSLNFADLQATKVDVTPINSKTKVEINGQDSAPTGSFDIFSDPLSATAVEMRKASSAKTDRVFVFTLNDQNTTIIANGEVSGGNGLSGGAGAVGSGGSVQLTLKHVQQYLATT